MCPDKVFTSCMHMFQLGYRVGHGLLRVITDLNNRMVGVHIGY